MSTLKQTKINKLLRLQPSGAVLTSSWLAEQGYSPGLLRRYREGHWLTSIGKGAMIRTGDEVDCWGGVYALQQQLDSSAHPAGKTALGLLGKTHYLEFDTQKIYLFGYSKENLPLWFKNGAWGVKINYFTSSFLPKEPGWKSIKIKGLDIKIAAPERAMMECLYLVPKQQDLIECYELMQGLNNLRPDLVQKLLEQGSSIKVKRLFMYLAEKANHFWFKHLQDQKIDFGSGKRSLAKNGVYVDKYKITVPKALEGNEQPGL